jgi:hypothetical protein
LPPGNIYFHQAKIELFAMGRLVIRLDESAVNAGGAFVRIECPQLRKMWDNAAAGRSAKRLQLAKRLQTRLRQACRRFA